MRTSRPFQLVAAVSTAAVLALGLTACGGDDDTTDDPSGSSVVTTDDKGATITIDEKDGKVTPDDGQIVNVEKGQQITLHVTTDADDEIHVHSEPEHEFEIKPGTKDYTFSIDTPATYEVESHGLEVVIVQLRVS